MSLDYTKLVEISQKSSRCCTVNEVLDKIGNAAKVKCHKTPKDALILSGFMAGMFIALGAYSSLMTGRMFDIQVAPTSNLKGVTVLVAGIQNLISAAVFPVGIIFLMWFGADLYMGNTMVLFIGLITGKAKWYGVLKVHVLCFLTNLAGSLTMAFLFTYLIQQRDNDNLLPWQKFCVKFCKKKCDMKFWELILRYSGILGTWCVNLAVFMSVGSKQMIGKIFGVWYPIFTFVAIGLDNSIAGAYFVALGVWYGAGDKYWGLFFYYVALVSIGNMIGGIFMVGAYQTWMMKRRGKWNNCIDYLIGLIFIKIGLKKAKKKEEEGEGEDEDKDGKEESDGQEGEENGEKQDEDEEKKKKKKKKKEEPDSLESEDDIELMSNPGEESDGGEDDFEDDHENQKNSVIETVVPDLDHAKNE